MLKKNDATWICNEKKSEMAAGHLAFLLAIKLIESVGLVFLFGCEIDSVGVRLSFHVSY